jgi:PAS domain S-box-containing protein
VATGGTALRRRSLRRNGLRIVAAPLIALFVTAGASAVTELQERRLTVLGDQSEAVRHDGETLIKLLVDAETSVRGYLLANDQTFLEPFRQAQAMIPPTIDRMQAATRDAQVRALLPEVRTLTLSQLSRLAEQVRLGRTDPGINADLYQSKAAMDVTRAGISALLAREDVLVAERGAAVERSHRLQVWLLVASFGFGTLGAVVGLRVFSSSVTARLRDLVDEEERPPWEGTGDEIDEVKDALAQQRAIVADRESQLAASRDFLEHIISEGPLVIVRRLPDTMRVEWVSANVERVLGHRAEDACGEPRFWEEHMPIADVAEVERALDEAMTERRTLVPLEYRFRHADGSWRTVESVLLIAYDDEGVPSENLEYLLDITDRREAEAEALASAATVQTILATSPDPIGLLDSDGRFISLSAAGIEMIGRPASEIIGHSMSDLIHPDEMEEVANAFRPVFTGEAEGAGIRHRLMRADGSELLVESHARAAMTPDGLQVTVVSRDITAAVYAEIELIEAKAVAEDASRAKTDFLSRMSHELRTPLNAILGFTQLLARDDLSPDQSDSVDQVLRAGRHLLALINDVLDIARIETGKLSLSPETIDVAGVVARAVDMIAPLADARHVQVIVAPESGDRVHVHADAQRLTQVLINLLSNAIKYNRESGRVDVRWRVDDTNVAVEVVDSGIGIPAHILDRVFTPFDRLGAEASGIEGSGVGLALSKRLLEAMTGSITVESTAGVGSVFTVTLPYAPDIPLDLEFNEAGLPTIDAPGPTRSATLLYIEDNLTNLTLVRLILRARPSVGVLAAMQGRVGIDLATQHRPDLILLDRHLPDMSGDEVLLELQRRPETDAIPVVVVSAEARKHEIEEMIAMGALAYLTKPLDIDELLRVVDSVLEGGEAA